MTEDKTTITDNEVIARFMGAFKKYDEQEGLPCMLLSGGGVPVSGWYFNDKEILYSTSWEWLMPVVEAIEEIEEPHPSNNPEKGTVWPYQVEILSRSMVQIIDNRTDEAMITVNEDGLTKIQAVYKAVLEFIRWYNYTQNKEQS